MGVKISDRTAATLATLLDTDMLAVAREDSADLKIAVSELRKAMARPAVESVFGTTRTLTEADDGRVLILTSGSATTVTVPDGLPLGFSCTLIRQDGAGAVTIDGDGTVLLEDEGSGPATGNTYAINTRGVASVLVHDATSPDTARVFGGIT